VYGSRASSVRSEGLRHLREMESEWLKMTLKRILFLMQKRLTSKGSPSDGSGACGLFVIVVRSWARGLHMSDSWQVLFPLLFRVPLDFVIYIFAGSRVCG
jgi:hypothetical protein